MAHYVVLELAGEALSSHEVPATACAASVQTGHMQSALELWGQLMYNVGVDTIVGIMAVARVAAPAIEAQAGEKVRRM